MLTVQRTVTILLADAPALRETLTAFQSVQNRLSPLCWNAGKTIGALQLQRERYHEVKGQLSSQMTIMAMRLVSGAYVSQARNYKRRLAQEAARKARGERKGWNYKPRRIKEPGMCHFERKSAMFLIGSRGRDASFHRDGTLSIWTVAGRKHITYIIPSDFKQTLADATEADSITVIERDGKLLGRVVVSLQVPEPQGIHPVGIDLNETNALVAVDADDNELFISGRDFKVRNKRSYKTRKRLQSKLASRKAQKKDTRSLRRLLKRHGRKRSNRTRTFAHTVAKQLCEWVKPGSVLVFEDLNIPEPAQGLVKGTALRRRLSLWQHGLIRRYTEEKAQLRGIAVSDINPAYTSRIHNRCGLPGVRKRHTFWCPACQVKEHADVNAARNIRDRFTVLRYGGDESTSPEALSLVLVTDDEGKPLPLGSGS